MPKTIELGTANVRRNKPNPKVLKWARQIHLLLGTFFAPAIIFFAFTGALQTFGLHEAAPESHYKPPQWLQKLAQLHKKQNLQTRPPRPQSALQPHRPSETPARAPEKSSLPLKCFTAAMSFGLILTSVLGVYMAFTFGRDKRLIWGLLIAGTLLPLLLIVI